MLMCHFLPLPNHRRLSMVVSERARAWTPTTQAAVKIGVAFLVLGGLTACSNIHNDRSRTQTEGALAGCAAGGLLGSILGDNRRSVAAGCVTGAAAGLAVGHHVANKKQTYASEEAYLRDVLAQAQQQTQSLQALNEQLLKDIERLHAEANALYGDYRDARQQQSALAQMKDDAEYRLRQIRQALARTDRELAIQRQVLAAEQSTAPAFYLTSAPATIDDLEREKATLLAAQTQYLAWQGGL